MYEGDWIANKMHGKGFFTWSDGRRYTKINKDMKGNTKMIRKKDMGSSHGQMDANTKYYLLILGIMVEWQTTRNRTL